MQKRFVTFLCALVFVTGVHAQSKDDVKYKERAAEVQDEIWGSGGKPFTEKTVPDEYKNESAVVLAKSFEVSNSSKKRFKISPFGMGMAKRYKYFTTLRERVKINDKSALEDFSTLEYKKNLNNTSSLMLMKIVETYKTYVGAKIIKPNGKEVVVSADEEVLTKNENKDKDGKLAIPDLQIGDILDYYVRIEEVTEAGAEVRGPNIFFLVGEYPILFYNVKYVLDKRCGADVMDVNGAKPMVQSTNDNDDIVLEFTEKNLPKYNNSLWSSPPRQWPYHIVRYSFADNSSHYQPGEIKRGPFTEEYKKTIKNYFQVMITSKQIDFSAEKEMENYFGGKKAMKDLPADSIVNYLYNYFHWYQYDNFFSSNNTINTDNSRNNKSMSWFNLSVTVSEILRDYDIENDIVLVSDRFSGRLKEVFGPGDFETFIKVNSGGKIAWLSFRDFFHLPGQLPAVYQGEPALILTRKGKTRRPDYEDSETPITLPIAKSADNVLNETLKVDFTPSNFQLLTIERTSNSTGAMKQDDQKNLMTSEEVEAGFAALLGKAKTADRMMEKKKSKAAAEELETAFQKERVNQKDDFLKEINGQYDQDPKELVSYKITENGFSLKRPAFEFKETFTMDNFVKKAGINYILEVGKLIGTYKKIEDKERTRTIDIYMSAARTLNYTLNINIPQGYNVKGIDELNKKVDTDIASFVSTAKQTGNVLTVTVSRTYNNIFEKKENWPKLLQVMDATADFTTQKVLLEKQK